MSLDLESDEEEFDETLDVPDARAAARRHLALGRGGAWGTAYRVESPGILVTLQTQLAASKCSHCGQVHHFLTVQRIEAKEKRRGHGRQFMRELLAALPDTFTSCGKTLPIGIRLQSVETEDSIGLANGQLGMTPVPGRMLEPPYEKFGDYHLCAHKQ
jgi:hypothetical protein